MAIKIGAISISLEASTASFNSEMSKASALALNTSKSIERSFTMMGAAISAATGAAIGSLSFLIERTDEAVHSMARMAAQSGTSIESFSKLAYAAKLAGMPVDGMASILTRISHSAFEAASGNKQAAAAYKELGVSVTDANGHFKTSDQIVVELAKSLNGYKDSAAKTGIEMMLMGRSGAESAEMLKILATRFDDVSDRAQRLGVVFNSTTTESAAKLHDSFVDLEEAGFGLSVRLLSSVAPALENLAQKIVEFMSNAENMRKLDEIGADIASGIHLAGEAVEFLVKHADAVKIVLEALAGIRLAGMFGPMVMSATEATGIFGKLGIASLNLTGNLLGIRRMGTVFVPLTTEAAAYSATLATLAKEEGIAATASLALGDATVGVKALMAALGATVAPAALAAGAVYSFGMALKGIHDYEALQKDTGASWWQIQKAEIAEATSSAANFLNYLETIAGLQGASAKFYSSVDKRLGGTGDFGRNGRLRENIISNPKATETPATAKKDLAALPQDEKADKLAQQLAELVNKAKAAQQALALVGSDPDAIRKVEIEKQYNDFLTARKVELDKLNPTQRAAAEAEAHAAIATAVNTEALTKYQTALLELSQTTGSTIAEHLSMAAAIGKSAQAMQDAAVAAQVSQEMQKIGGAGWRNNPSMVTDAEKRAQQIREQINAENRSEDAKSQNSTALQIESQQRLNDAIFQGAEARRQAALASEQAAIRSDFANRKDTDAGAMQAQLDAAQRMSELQKQAADRQRAAALDPAMKFREQEQALQDAIAAARAYGNAIDYRQALEADKDAWIEFKDAQDKAILASGNMVDGIRVALSQIADSTESDAQRMHDAIAGAINSLNDSLAKLMTGQKANFSSVFRGVGQSMAKASLEKAESTGLKALGLGGAGKPDGSESNPWYVRIASGLSSAASGAGNAASSALGTIGKMLIPGFADGGNYDAGMPRIVGERGIELDVPSKSGTVIPNNRIMDALGGSGHVFNIDARGSHDPAQTVSLIHQYMTKAAPQIVSTTLTAAREHTARSPQSKR